ARSAVRGVERSSEADPHSVIPTARNQSRHDPYNLLLRSSTMRTQELPDADGPRRWFLDEPEAQVLSAARERELRLQLADCPRCILGAARRPDGSEWDLSRPDAEFRRAVRGLAGGGDAPPDDPTSSAVLHLARRYEEIRGALAMANSRLVAYIARRYLNRG